MSKPSHKFPPKNVQLLKTTWFACKVLNVKGCNSCFFCTFLNPARVEHEFFTAGPRSSRSYSTMREQGLRNCQGLCCLHDTCLHQGMGACVTVYIYIYIYINLYTHIYIHSVKQADSECISILGSKGEGKAGSWGCKPNRSWKRAVRALLLCPLRIGTSRFEFLSSEIIWMLPYTHCRRSEAYEIHFSECSGTCSSSSPQNQKDANKRKLTKSLTLCSSWCFLCSVLFVVPAFCGFFSELSIGSALCSACEKGDWLSTVVACRKVYKRNSLTLRNITSTTMISMQKVLSVAFASGVCQAVTVQLFNGFMQSDVPQAGAIEYGKATWAVYLF